MIEENIYYEVENEEEAKWILDKMYEEGYGWENSNRINTNYDKRRNCDIFGYVACSDKAIVYGRNLYSYETTIKVSTLMKSSNVSAYAHNINVEVGDFKIKRTHGKYINVYGLDNMCIDQIRVENPKLKEILAVYGVELLEARKLSMNAFMVEMAENRDIKSVSVQFDTNDIEIYMKDGRVVRAIEMGIEVV